jgi:hypothetical protein
LFPIWESFFEVGEAIPVATHEGIEFEGVEVAGDVTLRLREGAEEPAEVELIGPDGDVDLVSGEECDGCSDAVYGGAVAERTFEVET